MRTHPRPRRELHPVAFSLLRPLLTFSYERDAWILVGVGERLGPVVRRRGQEVPAGGSSQQPPST